MSDRMRTVWDDPLPRRERNRLVTDCAQAMREQYRPENDAPEDEREAWRRIRYDAAKRLFRDEGETMIDQRVRLADEARERASSVRDLERQESNLRNEVDLLRDNLHAAERPYLLAEYSGKNQQIRDAQRDDEMDGDSGLNVLRDTLRERERDLRRNQCDHEYQERLYRIALAELRVLGTER